MPWTPCAKPTVAHVLASALRWPVTAASAAPELPSPHWPSSTASPRGTRSAGSAAITTIAPLKRHGSDGGCARSADQMLLGRHVDDKAGDPACVGQSLVIGDKRSQLPAHAQAVARWIASRRATSNAL